MRYRGSKWENRKGEVPLLTPLLIDKNDQEIIIIMVTNISYNNSNNSPINSRRVSMVVGGDSCPQVAVHSDSSPTASMANLTDQHGM